MRILLIGYGSIGARHARLLNAIHDCKLDIVTSRDIGSDYTTYDGITAVPNLSIYDYFIIASATSEHYEQLRYLNDLVQDKVILVEKPLFDKMYVDFVANNMILVAYHLRMHPILQELKKLILVEEVLSVNVICGQYLPQWRPDRDYRDCYSACLEQGGGVLNDLSHEIDYCIWLFGNIVSTIAVSSRVSTLDINSDDVFVGTGRTDTGGIINISLDYISKTPIRQLVIHSDSITILADIIAGTMLVTYADGSSVSKRFTISNDYCYQKMHENIMSNNIGDICSYNQGLAVVNFIASNRNNNL